MNGVFLLGKKMKYILLLLNLLCTCFCYSHELTVCCIFQNDAKYLPEWIEFHVDRGVEHFYMYNNLSTDDYKGILQPYIDSGLVDLIEWPYSYTQMDQWIPIQCAAYLDCIKKIKYTDRWCAFLDTDEFLFSPTNRDLKVTLKDYQSFSAIGVNWVMYGTSHVQTIPEGENIRDYLLLRSQLDFYGNCTPKSIVKPIDVDNCVNPHSFILKKNRVTVNENKVPFPPNFSLKNSTHKLRINHYWSRDMDYFYNQKVPRRVRWYGNADDQIQIESQLNEVYDPILSSKQI